MSRRTYTRRSRGFPLSPDRLLGFVDHNGTGWQLYDAGALPRKLNKPQAINLKLVCEDRVPGKANWRLLWTGVRISAYSDGARLKAERPGLFEAVEKYASECFGVGTKGIRFVPHAPGTASGAGTKGIHNEVPVCATPAAPPNGTLPDDGTDLI